MSKNNFFYRNSLSIVLIALMLIFWVGQFFTGWKTENKELAEEGQALLNFGQYIQSGHFIQATFENWESEFFADDALYFTDSLTQAKRFQRIQISNRKRRC